MRKILSLMLFLLLVMSLTATDSLADTGTYRILDYSVTLNPKATGEIIMDYSQTWLVTGGNIPWVTIGLPNADFQVIGWGGAAKTVKSDNEGDWYGARADLKKTYLPSEKFSYNFTILQRNLLDLRSDGYWLVFTPGWYDRCYTDKLSIKVISPVDLKNVTTNPKPVSIDGRILTFSKNNLRIGEQYKISIKFPKDAYKIPAQLLKRPLSSTPAGSQEAGKSGKDLFSWEDFIYMILILAFILFVAFYDKSSDVRDGYYDYDDPIVFSGSSRGRRGSRSNRNSGDSGAFGGRASSCACVHCACACACAGGRGGGAGCTKKWLHFCNKCANPNTPFWWGT